jgi:hypothetical protein
MTEKKIHYVVVEVTFDDPVLEKEARWSLEYALETHFTKQRAYRSLRMRRVRIPHSPNLRITGVKTFSKVAAYHRRSGKLNKNTWFGISAVAAGSAVGALAAFLVGGG